MRDITQLKQTLDGYNELSEKVNELVCKKYKVTDIDIVCVYLYKLSSGEDVLMGTYQKHNAYLPTNIKRYSITLDEYFNFIDKEQDNV
jgi:hypothetical protein